MNKSRHPAVLGMTGVALLLAFSPAAAESRGPIDRLGQMFGRSAPPSDYDDDLPPPVRADTGASVRVDRLENQVRNLTGQVEQLQFSLRQLQEQLRKYQQDTEFRFQESGGTKPGRRADDGVPPVVAQATPLPSTTPSSTLGGDSGRSGIRRGDAFDPTKEPNAPGAPRQIGTPTTGAIPTAPTAQPNRLPGGPVANDAATPMDLSGGRLASNGNELPRSAIVGTPLPPASTGPVASPALGATNPSNPVTTPGGTVIASHEPFSPKDEFDMASGYLKGGQYEAAEKGFASFLQKNPKNRLVPEAVFDLGETYFHRSRHREAAEQYLKISTTYSSSSRAPDAMLRLGQSLVALGAKEQACASFTEVARKFPNASVTVKASADREAKKNAC